MKLRTITQVFDGKTLHFDSPEEIWFAWWLEDLRERKIIDWWQYHSQKWDISHGCDITWEEQGTRKVLLKKRSLLRDHTYTCDFSFRFFSGSFMNLGEKIGNECRLVHPYRPELFVTTNRDFVVHVDVKGAYVRMESQDAKFRIIQGIVWDKYGDYINRVVPHSTSKKMPACLFRDTFTPRRFLFTDRTAKMRSIQYPTRSVEEWLKQTNQQQGGTSCRNPLFSIW